MRHCLLVDLLGELDFETFTDRVNQTRAADPRRVTAAGYKLVKGALRIRQNESGTAVDPNDVLGSVMASKRKPVTKPAEALGVWLKSLERDSAQGIDCSAEMRKALLAAGKEVNAAAEGGTADDLELRSALYTDALSVIGGTSSVLRSPAFPWVIAGTLGGILIGIFFMMKSRR